MNFLAIPLAIVAALLWRYILAHQSERIAADSLAAYYHWHRSRNSPLTRKPNPRTMV